LDEAIGRPQGLLYLQIAGGRYDDRFRRPRERKETAELIVELGATPFIGQYRDRSGESSILIRASTDAIALDPKSPNQALEFFSPVEDDVQFGGSQLL